MKVLCSKSSVGVTAEITTDEKDHILEIFRHNLIDVLETYQDSSIDGGVRLDEFVVVTDDTIRYYLGCVLEDLDELANSNNIGYYEKENDHGTYARDYHFYHYSKESNTVCLSIQYHPYDRYNRTPLEQTTVSGLTLLDALKAMVDDMGLYIDSDEIEANNYDADQVIESIIQTNGDGCDYITLLKNVTTGEIYIEAPDDHEEDEDTW